MAVHLMTVRKYKKCLAMLAEMKSMLLDNGASSELEHQYQEDAFKGLKHAQIGLMAAMDQLKYKVPPPGTAAP